MALNWLMRDYLSQLVTRYQQWLDVEDNWPAAWRDATSLDDDLLELTADQQVPLARRRYRQMRWRWFPST